MNSELPKQFLLLRQQPVLAYSLAAFYRNDPTTTIIVVLSPQEVDRWQSLCQHYQITIPHQIALGGATRTESVRNGLAYVSEPGLVAIHDGARPLIDNDTIERCYASALVQGSGVAAVSPKDSLRWVEHGSNKAIDRNNVRQIQTPQTFQTALVIQAFQLLKNATATDDATIVEQAGHPIQLVEGSYCNLKITTPEDLAIAETLL